MAMIPPHAYMIPLQEYGIMESKIHLKVPEQVKKQLSVYKKNNEFCNLNC